ncbi:MAG: restriction endonuclease [Anaerolineae bacterium]|nr:restriction endonuclease [Anaerolineae bacterium]
MRPKMPHKPHHPIIQVLLFLCLACIGLMVVTAFGVIRFNQDTLRVSLPFLPTRLSPTWLILGGMLCVPMVALAVLRMMLWLIEDQRYRILNFGQIDRMDGLDFEHYVARLLSHRGYRTHVTPGSNDYGVDVVAERGSERFAVQVKRYKGKVSRRAVSDAVGAMRHYNCNRCMVVTNSYYTDDAQVLADTNHCVLVDRDELSSWISAYKTGASGAWALKNTPTYGVWIANAFILLLTLATLYSLVAFLLPHTSVLGFALGNGQTASGDARPPIFAPQSGITSAAIEQVWVEPNVIENGVRGLNIHVRFSIANAKGMPHLLVLHFSNANKATHLPNSVIERSFSPDQNSQHYGDSLIFVPFDQAVASLSKAQNKYSGFVKAQIVQASDRRILAQSGDVAVNLN